MEKSNFSFIKNISLSNIQIQITPNVSIYRNYLSEEKKYNHVYATSFISHVLLAFNEIKHSISQQQSAITASYHFYRYD
jgi:hypothetical protein